MNPSDIVMQSYGRCCAQSSFFDAFYNAFLASSPEVKAMFGHSNMAAQKLLLRQGIMNIVLYSRGMPDTKLKSLGCSHSRQGFNIRPELYQLWVDALLTTVEQHDHLATADTLAAWRTVVQQGIDVIAQEY